jgi:lipoprotein-releasing system ATP-binding protein
MILLNIHKKIHTPLGSEILKIDTAIDANKITAIYGQSGAGKTTLLQILGTLVSASKREDFTLEIDAKDINSLNENDLAKFRNNQLGFIFQFHQLLPEFTALENVCIPAFIKGISEKEAELKAKKLLDFLGLGKRLHHKPSELSGGEQQRVSVARALINDPLVVLADEPSGNLDSASAAQLHQLFFELRAEYRHTFIIVTHNEELAAMADRKITMTDGKVSK